jgi:hypothetical protein
MTEARALAAEATAAAEGAAERARAQARAIAQQAASAPPVDAPRPEPTPAPKSAPAARTDRRRRRTPPLDQYTKAELLELARPLRIGGASRMTKDQLVRAVRSGSRRRQRS